MIFLMHIPENQLDEHCNPPNPRHIQDPPLPNFSGFVPWDPSHWVPSVLFHVLKGPLPRKAHHMVSAAREDFGMCSAGGKLSLSRSEHEHRLCVGVDVLSVSALNVHCSKTGK